MHDSITPSAIAPCTFVHVRRRSSPVDAGAAPADVLFDQTGHAFHHTRRHGVRPHHEAHTLDPATVPNLSIGRKDSVVWIGDEPFTVEVSPANPFQIDFPAASRPDASGAFHIVTSGPPRGGTTGKYKATFTFGAQKVDPDFTVGP